MAVIIPRKRKNGTHYTARVRVKRKGKTIVDESETFTKKSLATAWGVKRDAYWADLHNLSKAASGGISIGDVLSWYREEYQRIKDFGRTKLDAI